ncbi:mgtC family protein [Halorhabdus tiamatea SARL4B]|uniref:MgtC family protein n=1 Tax=Halorhabdus tiamatea SARL4B TaxID=1033806 RepID=U2E433_9EURY|nr:MgtC/SapB family protein [Halorhabdus tiamatea]ERJ06978.1 mgtC family protein [Halorhabdus tiamatea SARL4B]
MIGRLALSFGIGALVGLEREQSESGGTFAGSRMFPLIALYGALVAGFVVVSSRCSNSSVRPESRPIQQIGRPVREPIR